MHLAPAPPTRIMTPRIASDKFAAALNSSPNSFLTALIASKHLKYPLDEKHLVPL
ncbi:hypothetical protein M5D96_012139 [Drosophila gunungcola]|uniref:Uncharacterized protein n=1 Tax=Drosophila gunungcola TaxID=103775 RepID=A0A9Q0BKB2_9MUSC|nr:hypothetical protein M5D96_012139 [Drosophila gunungcola]